MSARADSTYEQAVRDLEKAWTDLAQLSRFAGMALDAVRVKEIGDWDGDEMQDAMVICGLLAPIVATEPCGEACRCAEYDEFPQTCYRVTHLGESALNAARVVSAPAESPR